MTADSSAASAVDPERIRSALRTLLGSGDLTPWGVRMIEAEIDASSRVPAWCRSAGMRGFVIGNALAAPLLILGWVIWHAS